MSNFVLNQLIVSHFREDGGDGWVGGGGGVGNLLKGKTFSCWGLRVQTSPPSLSLQPRLRPHFVRSRSLRFSFANFMTRPNSFNIIQQS